MKTNIAIDLEKNTVIVSNTFYKKASLYGTPEYYELRQAMIENPKAEIIFKSIYSRIQEQEEEVIPQIIFTSEVKIR